MKPDRLLDPVAARRYGLLTRCDAHRVGLDNDAIDYRCATGEWVQLHPDVFAIASAPRSWEQQLAAACLAAGPESAVSHRAGALTWGFAPFAGRLVELMVPYRRCPELKGVIVHRSVAIDPTWIVKREGIA